MGTTSTNYTSIGYERDWDGITTPELQLLPTTGGGPILNLTTTVSEVIRSDRMIDDLIITDAEVNGDTNYELSYTPYKPILIDLLRDSNTPTPVAVTSIVSDAATKTFASASILAVQWPVGSYFNVNDMTVTSMNGIYEVTVVVDGTITVAETLIDDAAATGTANKISYINGAASIIPYLFRKRVSCDSTDSNFFYPECAISSASFNFETGGILNGTVGVFGTTETALEDTELSGTAYENQTELAIPAYSIMNAVTSVANISLAGLTSDSCFQNMNITVDNGTQGAKCIGTLGAVDTADFTLNVTADITMYFCDQSVYKKFIAAESFSVALALRDGDGNGMVLKMPKCKFETLELPIDGKDNFLTLNGSLRALRDATDDYMFGIEFLDA